VQPCEHFPGDRSCRATLDSPSDVPRTVPAIPRTYRLRLARDPAGIQYTLGHALVSGFVQSIFSPTSRRPPFECSNAFQASRAATLT
jgi:hypothetical protein